MEGNWRKAANPAEAGNAFPRNGKSRTNSSWSQVATSNEGSWRKGANSYAQDDDRKGQPRNSSAGPRNDTTRTQPRNSSAGPRNDTTRTQPRNSSTGPRNDITRTNASRYNSGDNNRSRSQNSAKTSTASSSPLTVVVGKEYDAIVSGIRIGPNRGVFCYIGDINGFMPKVGLNAKTGCAFQHKERIRVVCMKTTDPLELRPTSEYVRPLLVLDINGPLGDRSPYTPHNQQRSFKERPHLKDFLALVAQHFEVAVWSCSLRQNLELSLFKGIDLLFVWCQDESTNLFPRRSCVATSKPLFLKEISKVWEQYPAYNASNTLLIDNHLEKFERNVFGTGLIVPDQGNNTEDIVLAEDGELCNHLVEMAAMRPLDITGYVSKRAGSSDFFPAQYPTQPLQSLQADIPCSASGIAHDISTPSQELLQTLAWQYILAVCNNDRVAARGHLSKTNLPGPRTASMSHKDIADVVSSEWVVCEKTDGEHAILVINPEYGMVYFVKRNLSVQPLILANADNQQEVVKWARGRSGLTVLDGELIAEHSSPAQSKQRHAFLCFDAVIVNGDSVGRKEKGMPLTERIAAAESFLASSPLYNFAFTASPLIFKCKEMTPVAHLQDLVARFTPVQSLDSAETGDRSRNESPPAFTGWVYDLHPHSTSSTVFPHLSDGLVFTPVNKPYFGYLAYKWKPAHLCSVDFAISLTEVSNAMQSKLPSFDPSFLVKGYVWERSDFYELSTVRMTRMQACSVLQTPKLPPKFLIVECAFSSQLGQWTVERIRLDRPRPNSLKTAWKTLEVIAHPLTLEGIVKEFQRYSLDDKVSNVQDGIDSSVGKHYDLVQASRQTGFREERIAVHRKVMNWSKGCLFKATMLYSSAVSDKCELQLLSALRQQQIDYSKAKSGAPNLAHDVKAAKKTRKKTRGGDVPSINVLDIACGRGGDIKKFTSDSLVNVYVGVDISREQLRDCADRASSTGRITTPITCLGDASAGPWRDAVPRSTDLATSTGQFDVAWCMFALHYFCETEEMLARLFSHVADTLKSGGKFACTFPNPYHICEQLRQKYSSASASKEEEIDKIYKVQRCEGESSSAELSLDACLTEFGHAYQFSLGDAVQDCKEFIVPFQRVLQIATENGLRICQFRSSSGSSDSTPLALSMGSWISDCCLSCDSMSSLRRVMGVTGDEAGRSLSTEEWEAISLYMCAVWVKV